MLTAAYIHITIYDKRAAFESDFNELDTESLSLHYVTKAIVFFNFNSRLESRRQLGFRV